MQKITKDSVDAFLNARPFKRANTKVVVYPNCTILQLYGNAIAYLYNDPERTLSITNCGWSSRTTKDRLNALPNVSIFQKDYQWYLNGKPWDGSLVDIIIK